MAILEPADNAAPYTYTEPIRQSIRRGNELTDDADTNTPKRIPVGVLATGTPTGSKFMRDDRTWAVPPGTGGTSLVHTVGNSGSTLTLDASSASGSTKLVTLNANCTVTLAGSVAGQLVQMEVRWTQDGTGNRTVTFHASTPVKWSGEQPTLSGTAGAIDRWLLTNFGDGSGWFGDLIGKAYA